MYIYRMYITKNGHRIYRKNRKPFRFWVDDASDITDENIEDDTNEEVIEKDA